MSEWRPTESAPRGRPLIVLTERGRIFKATLTWLDGDAGWTWASVEPGDPVPDCWTDGVCWTVNADEERSDWPQMWMEIPAGANLEPAANPAA